MMNAMITVGMTCYNAVQTIEKAIESALKQDYPNFEIVIVDDCSSDGSFQLVSDIVAQHEKIRIFQNKENLGVAGTRNHIISEAKGEFIAFFDDDDYSTPSRLQKQLARIIDLEKEVGSDALVICHSARRLLMPDLSEVEAGTMASEPGQYVNGIKVAEKIIIGYDSPNTQGACPTCSQMSRKSTYEKLGRFDVAFKRSEDTDFNVRLSRSDGYFVGIKEPLVTQNVTMGEDKGGSKEFIYQMMLLDKHRVIADKYGIYSFCKRWIFLKHDWLMGKKFLFLLKLSGLFITNPVHTLKRLFPAVQSLKVNAFYKKIYQNE